MTENSSTASANLFHGRGWVVLLRGLTAVAFGVLAFAWPGVTLARLVLLFGLYALVHGILSVAARDRQPRSARLRADGDRGHPRTLGRRMTLSTSLPAPMAFVFLVWLWAIATGILRIVEAIRLRKDIPGDIWLALSGVVTVLFGLMLVSRFFVGVIGLALLIAAFALICGSLRDPAGLGTAGSAARRRLDDTRNSTACALALRTTRCWFLGIPAMQEAVSFSIFGHLPLQIPHPCKWGVTTIPRRVTVPTETSSLGTAGFFRRNWWILLLRGLMAIALGILVFTRPFWTLAAVMLAFALYALVEGTSDLFAAIFGWRHRDDRWLLLLEALIGIGVGIVTLRTPGLTAIVVIFFIAAWALATGVLRIVEGLRLRQEIPGEIWLVLGGVFSVIFALLVMTRPLAGALTLVRVIGAYALILGTTEVLLAFKVRGARYIGRPGISEPSYRRVA